MKHAYSRYFRIKENQLWLLGGTIFFLAIGVMVLFFSPSINKPVVTFLWHNHHPLVALYLNHSDLELAVEMGNYYFGTGAYDLSMAERSYKLAAKFIDQNRTKEASPESQIAHYQLARIYFVKGDLDLALTEINTELGLFPYNKRALYIRGLIYLYQSNLGASEADFRAFIAWAPTEWAGYNDLAFVLAKEGKYKESEATLSEAFNKVPEASVNPWLWNGLGLAQLNLNEYALAEKSFKSALPLAQKVTPEQWHQAYSANDPAATGDSLVAFQAAIEKNIMTAQTAGTAY